VRTSQLSNLRIAGIAIVLFSAVILGVGIHHLVATGTCSSTGYSGNYGPVPYCPSGTGWWFAFVFGGVIFGLVGAGMATSVALVFAGIFGGIGVGALTNVFDANAKSGEKVFSAIFGGSFAVVGVGAAIGVIVSMAGSIRGAPARKGSAKQSKGSRHSTSRAASAASAAFGRREVDSDDPIMSAYDASRQATQSAPTPSPSPSPSPINLVPGLQAAVRAAAKDPVDELAKLAALHEKGALTDEEFSAAKAKLLGRM
jgi:Short C-terminal domain